MIRPKDMSIKDVSAGRLYRTTNGFLVLVLKVLRWDSLRPQLVKVRCIDEAGDATVTWYDTDEMVEVEL